MAILAQEMLPRCSVVMAVYKNDNPTWLKEAVESILAQTVKSNDFVIVRDGPVSMELENTLLEYERLYQEITIVRLDRNIGAGMARNEGVRHAKNDLIAIMDADDLSLTNRLELQVAEFIHNPNLALVGGQMSEFEGNSNNIVSYRKVPIGDSAIRKFARYRSPINHVTIMLKKSVFLKVGGYPKMTRAEDYYMVSSLLVNNYKILNIQAVLVNCRIGSENIQRRKTWRNVRENIISRWKIYKLGAISFTNFFVSSGAQVIIFITPVKLLNALFSKMLRSNS